VASPAVATKPGGSPAPLTVILDWYPWANHAGLYLAQRNGYFAAEGLDVKIEQPANPADVLKIVARNPNAIGFNYETDVLLARGEDIPVRSIAAIVQHPLNSVMTLKASNIARPRDLAGKTVGFPGIPSNEAYLTSMLERDGLKLSDVKLVDIGFDLVPALIGGRVDAIIGAYWAHESLLAELEGHPVNIMRVEQWGVPDYYEIVFVASDDLIDRNPNLATRFLRAVTRGYQDAIANPTAGVDAVLAANPQARRDLESRSIELLIPLWQEGSQPFGSQRDERWTAYAGWLKQTGLLADRLDPLTAFTTKLLPAG
jgi:putative hydroxymethylpyrimidine transport system substrate-binding protein